MNILWLGQDGCQDISKVGGKAASLSPLAGNHRVPPGFCLTTAAFDLWASGQEGESDRPFPGALYEELADAYKRLGNRCEESEPRVAVRSSAVDEDGQSASFAGQYETYLNRVGMDETVESVQHCWASLRSERALAYRQQAGLSMNSVRLAVLVQELIAADISAVVFTANPVTGAHDEVVINASWGLGESIVGGTVNPDTYRVRKDGLSVIERGVAEKGRMTVLVPGGTEEVDVPRFMRSQPALEDEQAVEMARMGLDLEEQMGFPVDVECALKDNQLYLLQCRPITTLDRSE